VFEEVVTIASQYDPNAVLVLKELLIARISDEESIVLNCIKFIDQGSRLVESLVLHYLYESALKVVSLRIIRF
jgi:hypothetical protein